MSGSTIKKCRSCGNEVNPQHTGKCPKCGNVGYDIGVSIVEHTDIKESLDVVHEGKRTKKSYPLLIISFVIVFVGSFGGYLAVGVWGVSIGIVLGLVSWYVGIYAITTEKFRNHYHKE